MRAGSLLLLLSVAALTGCDRLTGAADQKILDAEAIGYACRVSLKAPEDCMKENETHSPTSILKGWRSADKAITEGLIDPSMGKNQRLLVVPPLDSAAPAVAEPDNKAAPEKTPATAAKTTGK